MGTLDEGGSGFRVVSHVRPELSPSRLRLPGSDRQQDHVIVSWGFESGPDAEACMNHIREAVGRINKSADEVPPPTDPGWEWVQ